MDKHIESLALQCNAWFPDGYPSAEGGDDAWKNLVIFEKQDLEKLVRLVAEQCAEICKDNGNTYEYSHTPARAQLAKSTSDHCATLIKHKFGIQ